MKTPDAIRASQRGLLPLPTLEDTANRYVADLADVHDAEVLAKAANAIRAFVQGDGRHLQARLEHRNRTRRCGFFFDFWRDAYLENRASLTPWQNGVLLLTRPASSTDRSLACQAAGLICALLDIYRQALDPSANLGHAEQSRKLFGTSRIPGISKDTIRGRNKSKHVIVIYKAQIFMLPVLRGTKQASHHSLHRAIGAVLGGSLIHDAGEPPLGMLTSLPRAHWAALRKQLKTNDTRNAANLRAIETALVTLCLDEDSADDDEWASHLLCAVDGNRWHDRTVQFIVNLQGALAINFEHTAIDGLDLTDLMGKIDLREGDDAVGRFETKMPTPLRWMLSTPVRDAIDAARVSAATSMDLFRLSNLRFDTPSKPMLEAGGLGADFVAQFLFQASYWAVHRRFANAYESVSMRHFAYGRTDNLRPATGSCRRAISAFHGNAERKTIMDALVLASAEHRRRLNQCLAGKGIDRHLFALECVGAKAARANSPLFEEPFHTSFMRDFDLTTSSLPSSSGGLPCFINPKKVGFGIGYVMGNASLRVCISSWSARHDPMCEAMRVTARKLCALLT